jgi:hypothetical protein
LPRAPAWHAASYAEGPCFVGGRENDAAPDRNRLAAQARVEQLFDRRIEGVEVRVKNGSGGTRLPALVRHGERIAKAVGSDKPGTPRSKVVRVHAINMRTRWPHVQDGRDPQRSGCAAVTLKTPAAAVIRDERDSA